MRTRNPGRLVLVLALAAAGASCGTLGDWERALVFRPSTAEWRGYSPQILREEDVWIPVGGKGEKLHGWWLDSPGAEHTLVYFHGSRVNLSSSVYRLRGFRDAGYHVLAIDYRGFGRSSPGLPSEESVYEDAEAAWTWLDARVPDRRRRVLYGHSLGGSIAAEVALRGGGAAALVLEAAPTSVPELTVLGGLVTQRLDLLDKLKRLDLPVLVVHGKQDRLVPVEMAQRLYDTARGPKRLILVEEAGHTLVVRHARGAVFGALRELAASPR